MAEKTNRAGASPPGAVRNADYVRRCSPLTFTLSSRGRLVVSGGRPLDRIPAIALRRTPPGIEPVCWWAAVEGVGETGPLGTRDLLNFSRFRRAILLRFHAALPEIKPNEWLAQLDEALRPLREGHE